VRNLFLWLSGVDANLLASCERAPESERLKFAGIGGLVLIPAVLGFFSSMYAISTLTSNWFLIAVTGVVWGCIVLAIDRYLVRYVFAIFVGIAVSHPVVLLWFDDSIRQTIEQNRRAAVDERLDAAEQEKRTTASGSAEEQLDERREYLDCLRRLQTAEQTKRAVKLPCGYSSGLPTCGSRCLAVQRQQDQVLVEIQRLEARAKEEEETLSARRGDIDDRARGDVADIEAGFSSDYLARVDALAQVEKGRPHVTQVKLFILILFVLVDIMPITMKLATPMGEYEEIRDTLMLEARVRETSEREVVQASYAEGPHRTSLEIANEAQAASLHNYLEKVRRR
jgi:hypothetical protein